MYRLEHKIKMFNKQTSVVKYSEIMKILINYYTEEEFYMPVTVYKFILFSLSGY